MMIVIPQIQELIKANIQRSKVIQDQVIVFNINININIIVIVIKISIIAISLSATSSLVP